MIVVSLSIISMVIFTCGDSNLGLGHHRCRNDSGVGDCFGGDDCHGGDGEIGGGDGGGGEAGGCVGDGSRGGGASIKLSWSYFYGKD